MQANRVDGPGYMLAALFVLPEVSTDRVVIGGVIFDPCYLKNNLFPEMLEASVNQKTSDQGGNRIAMMISSGRTVWKSSPRGRFP